MNWKRLIRPFAAAPADTADDFETGLAADKRCEYPEAVRFYGRTPDSGQLSPNDPDSGINKLK